MNKYLLLRDNKQSGPYSVDELALHGLKAYDLVWLEGKSAAWRYPSEMEELKSFAPVVEEQPFDRFYKKTETKTNEPAIKDNTRVNKNSSYINEEIKKTETATSSKEYVEAKFNGTKKIHVSLPTTKSVEPSVKSSKEESEFHSIPVSPPVEKFKPVSQPVLIGNPISYTDNKKNDNPDSKANFEKVYTKIKQKEPVQINLSTKEGAPVSKLLFRSIAAACLLLGGALIGLIINYNSQQKKFQQLNQLVQEIKHKENTGSTKAVKNENISGEIKPAAENPVPLNEEPVYKEDIQIPLTKKNSRDKKTSDPGNKNTADTQLSKPVVEPQIVNEEPVQKPDKQYSEIARKNLWQLVKVDHNPYKTGLFGGISNLTLKLSNKSLFQLEQVEVEVLYLTLENKTVNKQKVTFENVSPGEHLMLNIPKSNRGVKIDYSIKIINTKEFGLAHAGMY